MTDREKLVEIVCNAIQEVDCISHCNHPPCYKVHHVVDELISHGVTVKEPQKPLTVEETLEKRVVYLEFKHLLWQEPVLMYRAWNEWEDAEIIHYDRFGCEYSNIGCKEKDYGKTWRCWAEKPTDAERKNAKWEE